MKLMKFLDVFFTIIFTLLIISAVGFVIYGITTDCPDTAIYVNCSEVE